MKRIKSILAACLILFTLSASAQDYRFNPRYSYYTTEKLADLILALPQTDPAQPVKINISLNGQTVYQADTTVRSRPMIINIPIANMGFGTQLLTARIIINGKSSTLQSNLVKLPYKANGVRIDRLTGQLIVNGLPWFPFGFYCYSPVEPTVAGEEVVKGFNTVSPYQTIEPGTINERQKYMDRCAQLGMKVHYQLISIAGGGGVGSSRGGKLSGEQKMNRLKQEIEHFRDHPALLAWYLSDEPTGNGVTPDSLQKIYDFVRELDPYHPITIVFDAPQRALEYADVMDIVMADPYPIPNADVEGVGSVTEGLKTAFEYRKPVWIVPQAFGGGEWWGREPSPMEARAMTYLALVRGATGIQYFIRKGPNGFPKSNVTWSECAKVAMEVSEMSPYLLGGKPVPEMMKERDGIWTNAWQLDHEILIMAVNAAKEPRQIKIDVPSVKNGAGVEVLFEDRNVVVADKQISDWIGPLGAQVYRIGAVAPAKQDRNLISDPGFENTLSYGVPAYCYARVGSDPGATAFLDTRTYVTGYHSLRMITPADRSGMSLSFFPVSLNSGQSYRFSIWAKADTLSWLPSRKLTFFQKFKKKNLTARKEFRVQIGDLADHTFEPSSEWLPWTFYFTVPENSAGQVKIVPSLELVGQGTAWFDDMILTEDPVITYSVDPKSKKPEISLSTTTPDATIRYNLEGKKPRKSDPEFSGPFGFRKTISVAAGIFTDDRLLTWTVQSFKTHLGVGHPPVYDKKYNTKYSGGGALGLVDGQSGSRNYQDGKWQGFNGQDLKAVIDLDSVQTVTKVSVGFLQNTSAWIFMPLKMDIEGSADGKNYKLLGSIDNQTDEHATGAIRKDFTVEFDRAKIRYIRVKAVNRKTCPDWHNGKGKAAFIFADEITVE